VVRLELPEAGNILWTEEFAQWRTCRRAA